MARIMIDANILLDLYKTSDPSFLVHAEALAAIKNEVFISAQVRREVQRNKLKTASTFLGNQLKEIKSANVSLPGFPEEQRMELKSLHDRSEALRKLGAKLAMEHLDAVSRERDEISKALEPIMQAAKDASPAEHERAVARRLLGDPPGKATDPLGDQLTWEQFLGQLDVGPVWVVSKDGDYHTTFDGSLFLNTRLRSDLTTRLGSDVKVHVFSSLPKALAHIREQLPEAAHLHLSRADQKRAESVEQAIRDAEDPSDHDYDVDDSNMDVCSQCEPGEDRFPAIIHWSGRKATDDGRLELGNCDWCQGLSVRCRDCRSVTPVHEGLSGSRVECAGGCGLAFDYTSERNYHGEVEGESFVIVDETIEEDDDNEDDDDG